MASWFQSQLQHYSSAFAAAFALLPVQEFEMSLQVATDGVGLIFSIPVLPLGKANLSLMKLLWSIAVLEHGLCNHTVFPSMK